MVRVDDILRNRQRHIVSNPGSALGVLDDVPSVARMTPHLRELFRRETPGFVQHPVGHADLADVVERRETGEELDPLGGQVVAEVGMLRQLLRDDACVLLRALGMPAGFRITNARQRQQRLHHQPMRLLCLEAGALGAAALDAEGGDGHRRQAAEQAQGRIEREKYAPSVASSDREPVHAATTKDSAAIAPQMSPNRATTSAVTVPRPMTACVSSVTPCSGRYMKSRCSRLSATVAWTSTPANNVSSGVATTSRVPRAVVPTKTIRSRSRSGGTFPFKTSIAEMYGKVRFTPR